MPTYYSKKKYKGVEKRGNKYRAYITIEGRRKGLGTYETSELAALAYNSAAEKEFKEYALLNNIKIDIIKERKCTHEGEVKLVWEEDDDWWCPNNYITYKKCMSCNKILGTHKVMNRYRDISGLTQK